MGFSGTGMGIGDGNFSFLASAKNSRGFEISGIGDFLKSMDFFPGLEIFLNMGIFIPGIGDFKNLRIFIPGIGDFYPWRLGIFGNLGIFITGIFAKSRGYLQNPRDLYPGDLGIQGDF